MADQDGPVPQAVATAVVMQSSSPLPESPPPSSPPAPMPSPPSAPIPPSAAAFASAGSASSTLDWNSVSLDQFEFLQTTGTGRYGRVRLCRHRPTGEFFAMKICPRSKLTREDQIRHSNSERAVLLMIDHPFIVKLHRTFKDSHSIYFLFEYIPGGELFSVLRAYRALSEKAVRFYAAQIVLALEYLHARKIVYRDLKPENLLLDQWGYLKLVDLGFAKVLTDGRTYTRCGTPEYRAPEIIRDQGHGLAADWWTLGILVYEMLVGVSPFNPAHSDDKAEIYRRVLEGIVRYPSFLSVSARELIRALLHPDPERRLGARGDAADVRAHAFFLGVPWERLSARMLPAPVTPLRPVRDAGDTRNYDVYEEEEGGPAGAGTAGLPADDPFADF